MGIGLFEEATYITESLPVGEGACLLVYSDGLYEVPLPGGKMWSLPEFMDVVEECRGLLGATDGLDHLLGRIQVITADAPFTDDYSVILALLS